MRFPSKVGHPIPRLLLAIAPAVLLATMVSATAEAETTNAIENSVVKIFSTVVYPDPYKPWTKRSPVEVSGSGVVIEGKRILSNAHVVLYSSQVQVQANQAGDKFSARVEAIAPGIDLAVLKLDDESFFDSHPAVTLSKTLPRIKDSVMAYGYPEGGNSLSITKGIVSRIEFSSYSDAVAGLRIQIDAGMNPGNSGGPVVAGDKMIGLAFSHIASAQNIGYIIPCEEVEYFLEDIADGRYDGKPTWNDEMVHLENPALRAFLKLDKSVEGILVTKPDRLNSNDPLKEWDVVTKIGEMPIDNQGMAALGDNMRFPADYLFQKLVKNGRIPLTLIRQGKEMKVELQVWPRHLKVIPHLEGDYPSCFIYGPLVFTTVTKEFVGPFLRDALFASTRMATRLNDMPAFEGEGLVAVAAPYFPHKLTKGYSDASGAIVKTVNGIAIKNLVHFVKILRDSKDEFINIEFDGLDAFRLVFRRADMETATEEILVNNGIRSQGSPDTLAAWNPQRSNSVPITPH